MFDVHVLETLYLAGTATNLRPNDPLLFVFSEGQRGQVVRFVDAVEPELAEDRTRVTLQAEYAGDAVELVHSAAKTYRSNLALYGVSPGGVMAGRVVGYLTGLHENLQTDPTPEATLQVLGEVLPKLHDDLANANDNRYTNLIEWVGAIVADLERVESAIRARSAGAAGRGTQDLGVSDVVSLLLQPPSRQPPNRYGLTRGVGEAFAHRAAVGPQLLAEFNPLLSDKLYRAWRRVEVTGAPELDTTQAFRVKAAPFGHNAPLKPDPDPNLGPIERYVEWDLSGIEFRRKNVVWLDAEYEGITPGSWVIIERADETEAGVVRVVAQVADVRTVSRADYGVTGRVTQITLKDREWLRETDRSLAALQGTTIYAASEALTRSEEPIGEPIEGASIELDRLYDGLEAGRWLVVSGERTDVGIGDSELVMLMGVEQTFSPDLPHETTRTTLRLARSLAYAYKRGSVTIYGNVVKATHGETREEVLGSGDGSTSGQRLPLRQAPLTYLSAPTPSGADSELEVRVDGVRWQETDNPAGLGPRDRGYVTLTDDDDKITVMFGTGKRGSRLPTGAENVTATYRTGIGKVGNAKAEQISLLATRPLGVKSVVNPLRASGGADRESRDQARRNVPIAVSALDRLVSVADYADFARTFAGIAKASSVELSDGDRQVVHVTIAGADDIPIDLSSDLYRNLDRALREFGEPHQPIILAIRELLLIVISARVSVLADYLWELVEPQVRAALLDAFSFERRELAQDVVLSEVISVIQQVPGVDFVDVDVFSGVPEGTTFKDLDGLAEALAPTDGIPESRVSVSWAGPRPGASGAISPAQLAYLSPAVPDTLLLTEVIA